MGGWKGTEEGSGGN